MSVRSHWLMKSEPDVFSIHDLANAPNRTTPWEGVRNYQARNYMRDQMRPGDGVLFYHSNAQPPAIVGTAHIASSPYPDPTQFDPESEYYDPKSTSDAPRWMMVDVKLDRVFEKEVTREMLASTPGLETMAVLQKGSRLSITPVTPLEWRIVTELAP
jgi:predicted RNA-binding protein with PUA-like domain